MNVIKDVPAMAEFSVTFSEYLKQGFVYDEARDISKIFNKSGGLMNIEKTIN